MAVKIERVKMCGICGILFFEQDQIVDKNILVVMRDQLTHRGPDDAGIYLNQNVGLGHRRLSIVDLTQAGHQPMCNENSNVWIVHNGEIYNYQEIKSELLHKGHIFSSNTDTEMIVHAYEEYGEECVGKFRGMFAFAIWDERQNTLFLARDRLGIKPLYYFFDKHTFVFASEIKAILASKTLQPEFNEEVVPNYLANRFPPGDKTFFKDIRKLLPGHTLKVSQEGICIQEYWDILTIERSHKDNISLSRDGAILHFSKLFEESVRLRLMSDVPIGMFLSGGIDSSAICAVMSKLVDGQIKTFSVGFEAQIANEFRYSRLVSQYFKTDHYEIEVTPERFFEVLPQMIWHEDEPIAHASSVPLYFVAELARKYVKVVLTGEGSDELLAGYYRYPRTLWNYRLGRLYKKSFPAHLRRYFGRIIEKLAIKSPAASKLSRTFLTRPVNLESLYFDNFSVFNLSELKSSLDGNFLEALEPLEPFEEFNEISKKISDKRGLLSSILYTDIKTYLVELLMKQDQMSMAASVESRVPFLDHKLVEYSFGLPDNLKVRRSVTKYILREAMKSVLPNEILKRRKMGFPVPLDNWFRGSYLDKIKDILGGERFKRRKLMKAKKVDVLMEQHHRGIKNNGDRLWLLLNLELWHRIFIDREDPVDIRKSL